MGQRSRKRRREGGQPAAAGSQERRRRVPGAERDAQRRAELEALRPGERPVPVTIAAILALIFGVANLALFAAGYSIRGQDDPSAAGAIAFAAIMLMAAAGLWQVRYWAVLGFQCLLALTGLSAGLGLLVASNLQAVILCIAIIGACGTLFWFLIRAMARIQMPSRPDART